MSEESFFSIRMTKMSDSELKKYVDNKDEYQDYAVISAVLELEKRGIHVENSEQIKQNIEEVKGTKIEEIGEPIETDTATFSKTPLLYSTQFIFIFGALFSVFGGGILMAMNLFQLKKVKAAKLVVVASLGYTILLIVLFDFLGITNAIISLTTSILGVFLLEQFIWKKEVSSEINFEKRDVWKPVAIGLLIALPMAYFMIASGNFPQQ